MTDQATDTPADGSPAAGGDPDRLQAAKGFIFDMDGVLYLGSNLLPGVNDMFNALRVRNIPFLLATNNSTATPQDFVERLAKLDVDVDASSIQTSTTATRDYLLTDPSIATDARILTVGMPSIPAILSDETSFVIVRDDEEPETADVVVVGLDTELTYDTMWRAVRALEHGAAYIATNDDDRLPNESGYQPGAGACIAGISVASRRTPTVIGKPQPHMMTKGVEHLGCQPSDVVMVGDRLDTDIAAADRAGLMTALVLTGVSTRSDLGSTEVLPDYVFNDLPALLQGFIGHA